MPVLGIIACRAFEDELAHVLSEDGELRHLIIVNNMECSGLSRKLRSRGRPHLLYDHKDIPEVLNDINRNRRGFLKGLLNSRLLAGLLGNADNRAEEVVVVVNVLKIALHIDNKVLRAEVIKSIDEMAQLSHSILLFYGRCGDALQDIEEPLGGHCPLAFLTDDSGERVDDCIAAALGGNKQYGEALCSHPGVGFFLTPMWASILGSADKEAVKYAFEHHLKPQTFGGMLTDLGYTKIARIDTGLKFSSDFEVESPINEFASLHNFEVVKLYGNVKIAEKCYKQARGMNIYPAKACLAANGSPESKILDTMMSK